MGFSAAALALSLQFPIPMTSALGLLIILNLTAFGGEEKLSQKKQVLLESVAPPASIRVSENPIGAEIDKTFFVDPSSSPAGVLDGVVSGTKLAIGAVGLTHSPAVDSLTKERIEKILGKPIVGFERTTLAGKPATRVYFDDAKTSYSTYGSPSSIQRLADAKPRKITAGRVFQVLFLVDGAIGIYDVFQDKDPTLSPLVTYGLTKAGIIDAPEVVVGSLGEDRVLAHRACAYPDRPAAFPEVHAILGAGETLTGLIVGVNEYVTPTTILKTDSGLKRALKKAKGPIYFTLAADGLGRLSGAYLERDPGLLPLGTYALDKIGFIDERTGKFEIPQILCDVGTNLSQAFQSERDEDSVLIPATVPTQPVKTLGAKSQ